MVTKKRSVVTIQSTNPTENMAQGRRMLQTSTHFLIEIDFGPTLKVTGFNPPETRVAKKQDGFDTIGLETKPCLSSIRFIANCWETVPVDPKPVLISPLISPLMSSSKKNHGAFNCTDVFSIASATCCFKSDVQAFTNLSMNCWNLVNSTSSHSEEPELVAEWW